MYPMQRRQAYNSAPPEGNPRRTEAWALTEAARRMAAAQANGGNRPEMLDAVRRNWRLWTIFQASLLQPDCGVPDDIRGNMLSLANFIDKHTVAFLINPQPEKLNILITVNREIAAGLLTQPVEGAAAGAPKAAQPGLSAINQSA